MSRRTYVVFTLAVLSTLLTATAGFALPVSGCTGTADPDTYSCMFYPTDSGGNPATDTGIIQSPGGSDPVGAGYLVFLDYGYDPSTADLTDMSIWDEVLWFEGDVYPHAGDFQGADEYEVFTGAAMPSYATVTTYNSATAGMWYGFFEQNADGIYTYVPDTHSYTIYDASATAAAAATPEPATVGLILVGLIGLWAIRARLAFV